MSNLYIYPCQETKQCCQSILDLTTESKGEQIGRNSYESHELLDGLGVGGDEVGEGYGDGDVHPELGDLQDPLGRPQRRHGLAPSLHFPPLAPNLGISRAAAAAAEKRRFLLSFWGNISGFNF